MLGTSDQTITAKKLRLSLKMPANTELLNFARAFWGVLRKANPSLEYEDKIESQRALDAMARLLVGDEICAAIAISGDELLLATNRDKHPINAIQVKTKAKIIATTRNQKYVTLSLVAYLSYNNGPSVRSISTPLRFRYYQPHGKKRTSGVYKLVTASPTIEFTAEQHNLVELKGEPLRITIKTARRIPGALLRKGYRAVALHEEFDLPSFSVIELNPFRRRIACLIDQLSFIVRCVQSNDISLQARGAKNRWQGRLRFLINSIAYEMSVEKDYKNIVDPYDFSDTNESPKALNTFLESLLADYERFKQKTKRRESVESIQNWAEDVQKRMDHDEIRLPDFIKAKPEWFKRRGLMYFVDLVKVELFVEQDAKYNGALSVILKKESLFSKKISPIVIGDLPDDPDNKDDLHAEMRLFVYHLEHRRPPSDYFGITKLCCGHCTCVMKHFNMAGYRGSSANLFFGWVLSKALTRSPHVERFLGDAFSTYQQLREKTFVLHADPKTLKQDGCMLALQIVSSIKGINDRRELEALGLDPSTYFEEAPSLFPLDPEDRKQLSYDDLMKKIQECSWEIVKQWFQPLRPQAGTIIPPELKLKNCGAGGDCLFRSISSQTVLDHEDLRELVCAALLSNRAQIEPLITANTTDQLTYTDEGEIRVKIVNSFDEYLAILQRPGTWGGQMEIAIAAQVLGRAICLIAPGYRPQVFPSRVGPHHQAHYEGSPIFIHYNGGDHYRALAPTNPNTNLAAIMDYLKDAALGEDSLRPFEAQATAAFSGPATPADIDAKEPDDGFDP